MFGVEINYKNGKKDWIDPVLDEPTEKDGILEVKGGLYTYEYPLKNIKEWFKYDLCKQCDYDMRTYDCTDSGCFNPRHT